MTKKQLKRTSGDRSRSRILSAFFTLAVVGWPSSTFATEPAAVPASTDVFLTLTKTPVPTTALPSTAEIVRPEEFKTWSAQTAGEVVSRLTSIQVQPVGGLGSVQTVKVRGSTTNENLVLIDGRPIGGVAFGSSQDLTEIPVEAIDHIEIVRGGVSALYGPNAISGVINIITKRAVTEDRPVISAGYEGGSYGRNIFRGSVGAKNGALDAFFYGNRQAESGFRANSDAASLNAGGNVGYSLGNAGKLTLDGSAYQSEIGIPGQLFPDLPTNQYNNDIERQASSPSARQDTRTQAFRTAYDVSLPVDSKMSIQLWDSQRRILFKDPDSFIDTERYEYSKGVETQFNLPLGLTVGGNFINDREDSTDKITPANTFIRSVENWALYTEDTMHWKAWTLIPGGRFDHHGQFGDTWNPRVQLLADATDWLRFSGSAARSFRAPTIDELYYPFTDFGTFNGTDFTFQGNPNLRPEKAWTYDAGFELHAQDVSLKATYFRANVANLIQSVNNFIPGSPNQLMSTSTNVGKARRQGLEIQIAHTVNRYFKDAWNYTYLDNRGIPVGFSEYVNLAYSPRHTLNYFATITPAQGWSFDHTVRFVDARFSTNNDNHDGTGSKLGSMVLWDMRVARTWTNWETYFQVKDVTDRRYEEQAGYPLPGRTFIGGLTWKYR